MRDPKVLVGVRHYKDDDKDRFDVEVFANNEYGKQLAEKFMLADAGIVDFIRLYEDERVYGSNHPAAAYDPRGSIESHGADLEKAVQWVIDNVDAEEAYRVMLTTRLILKCHPNVALADAIETAVIWERG